MDEELNYLSEEVESLGYKIAVLSDNLDSGHGVGGRIGKEYRANIKKMEREKQLLENIMSALTISEIESIN